MVLPLEGDVVQLDKMQRQILETDMLANRDGEKEVVRRTLSPEQRTSRLVNYIMVLGCARDMQGNRNLRVQRPLVTY